MHEVEPITNQVPFFYFLYLIAGYLWLVKLLPNMVCLDSTQTWWDRIYNFTKLD